MIKSVVNNFYYKPGYLFDVCLESCPGWVLLRMQTPPTPLIGTEVCAPITISKVLPSSVLAMSDVETKDLLIGLCAFWERHEMDEWLSRDEPSSFEDDHSIDKVNAQLAHANLYQLQHHARWFKEAPRPLRSIFPVITVGKVQF